MGHHAAADSQPDGWFIKFGFQSVATACPRLSTTDQEPRLYCTIWNALVDELILFDRTYKVGNFVSLSWLLFHIPTLVSFSAQNIVFVLVVLLFCLFSVLFTRKGFLME